MPVTADKAAPYAPSATVIDVMNRYRDRGLPTPVTKEVLARAGVPDSLNARVMQALQTLDLIDETGQPTATFEGIRRAPQGELNQRKQEWLNGAYADALNFVDPANADEMQVRDAFRNYNPVGQQARMVSLFMGLYADAGLGSDGNSPPRAPRPPRQPRASAAIAAKRGSGPHKLNPGWTKVAAMQSHSTPELPPALAGMMASLPLGGQGWTQGKRDQFLKLFGTALDWCIPIIEQTEDAEGDDE